VSVVDSGDVEFVDLATHSPEPRAIARIPKALALAHDVLSLSADENELTVALPEGEGSDTIDRIRFATGMRVHAVRAHRSEIRARLKEAYGFASSDAAPAVRAVDEIHEGAVAADASDIHLEPAPDGGRIRYRVDGMLRNSGRLSEELFAQTLLRLKLLAGMDIADRRQPQDGHYAFESCGRSIDARVSSLPTVHGEKLVVRLLKLTGTVHGLARLGMTALQIERFRCALKGAEGFIAVSGPTGSGKTTTLYAALSERNVPAQNICSIEDPVEVYLSGVTQVQINPRAGLNFSTALRGVLRQDPDVVMVGETRDAETASIAAAASLTGKLVLTTLHSIDALRVIDRLIELGVKRQTLAAGMSAIIAQRLVRLLCRRCRLPAGAQTQRGRGCVHCSDSGFSGRTGIFEVLVIDNALRDAIGRGAPAGDLERIALAGGFETLAQSAMRLAADGETSADELARALRVGTFG